MKKIHYLTLSLLITLTCFPTIFYAKDENTAPIYAVTSQGGKLTPESFIPTIEAEKQIKINDISFSDANRANTMTTGIFKTSLTYTDSSKNKQQEKLAYLIYPKEPTLFFNHLSYDTTNKELAISLYDSNATIYMTADQQLYSIALDSNGNFRGKYNPGEQPEKLSFIALDNDGNWSDTQTITLSNQKIKTQQKMLTATEYNQLKSNSQSLSATGSKRSTWTITLLIIAILLSILLFITFRYFSVKKLN